MAMKHEGKFSYLKEVRTKVTAIFVKSSAISGKLEVQFSSLKWLALIAAVVFLAVVLFMPEDSQVQFSEQIRTVQNSVNGKSDESRSDTPRESDAASGLWAAPKVSLSMGSSRSGSEVNHNTSMVIGPNGGNAKTQLRAGVRLPLRILDTFIVSQDSVPILAELILESGTDSGLRLPAGTRFYGEASFQKGANRASIQFKQISLPNGQIRPISGIATGKDGQTGIQGRVFSDGMKNTAGEVITTFVAGLAAGSIQTDIFGKSKGGIENGLLNAVAETAKGRAQTYGANLKAEREWIEVKSDTECDAILNESLNLQEGGGQ